MNSRIPERGGVRILPFELLIEMPNSLPFAFCGPFFGPKNHFRYVAAGRWRLTVFDNVGRNSYLLRRHDIVHVGILRPKNGLRMTEPRM
jgi:hypothetical protein